MITSVISGFVMSGFVTLGPVISGLVMSGFVISGLVVCTVTMSGFVISGLIIADPWRPPGITPPAVPAIWVTETVTFAFGFPEVTNTDWAVLERGGTATSIEVVTGPV